METLDKLADEVDRLKHYLSNIDKKFNLLPVVVPSVQMASGSAALIASAIKAAQNIGAPELDRLQREADDAIKRVRKMVGDCGVQLDEFHTILHHIETGEPIQGDTSLHTAARTVRLGQLAGYSTAGKVLADQLKKVVEQAASHQMELAFRTAKYSSAIEIAVVKNTAKFYEALVAKSEEDPASILAVDAIKSKIASLQEEAKRKTQSYKARYVTNPGVAS